MLRCAYGKIKVRFPDRKRVYITCSIFMTKGSYTFHQVLFTSYVKDLIQGHYLYEIYSVKTFL